VVVGTLGKALGSYGAYAACSAGMARYLLNAARPFIFSTALPPPAVAAAHAALEILDEEPRRMQRLQDNAAALRDELAGQGFDVGGSASHIVPLVIGDADLAVRVCEAALERGVFAQAIRPPTVAPGTSRLRLAVMATHRASELRDAARTLARAAASCGVPPETLVASGAGEPETAAAAHAAHGSSPDEGAGFAVGVAPPVLAAPPPAAARFFDGEAPEHSAPIPRAA
jgi:glycine C-acetyltransferase/8-amino-7-oxononanoate synthase